MLVQFRYQFQYPMNTLPYAFHTCKYVSPHLSFSTPRRRSRRRRNRTTTTTSTSPDNDNINLLLDLNQISIVSSSKSKIHQFLSASRDAYTDLTTVVSIDEDGRVFLSCRKSTIHFVGGLLFAGFFLVFVIRVFVKLGLGFRSRSGVSNQSVVVRRDRSLGGREVVVGTNENSISSSSFGSNRKALENPLSPAISSEDTRRLSYSSRGVRNTNRLPKWWSVPESTEDRTLVVHKEDYQREANGLIRGRPLLL